MWGCQRGEHCQFRSAMFQKGVTYGDASASLPPLSCPGTVQREGKVADVEFGRGFVAETSACR